VKWIRCTKDSGYIHREPRSDPCRTVAAQHYDAALLLLHTRCAAGNVTAACESNARRATARPINVQRWLIAMITDPLSFGSKPALPLSESGFCNRRGGEGSGPARRMTDGSLFSPPERTPLIARPIAGWERSPGKIISAVWCRICSHFSPSLRF
jgi:hypothetical protein